MITRHRRSPFFLASLVAALIGLWVTPALAWGSFGHRTVATIALKNVAPSTRDRIAALLKAERQLGTPNCRVRSLEDAAVWADCIRADERWRWAYTAPWHFHDIQICGEFDIKQHCANGSCATAQIERNARILADRTLPAAQRLEALAFLTHFVGDIHQPLHGADNHDRGGNGVTASYGIVPARNLHSIWDSALAERAISSASPPLARSYSAAERQELATGQAADWLRESWHVARDFLYPQALDGQPPCSEEKVTAGALTEADIQAAVPIVNGRIERAGLRLARMLDQALT